MASEKKKSLKESEKWCIDQQRNGKGDGQNVGKRFPTWDLAEKSKEEITAELLTHAGLEILRLAIDQLEPRIREKLAVIEYEKFLSDYKKSMEEYERKLAGGNTANDEEDKG